VKLSYRRWSIRQHVWMCHDFEGLRRILTFCKRQTTPEDRDSFADGHCVVVRIDGEVPVERCTKSVLEPAAYEIHRGIVSLSPGDLFFEAVVLGATARVNEAS
jgi:hypothetical protein